MDEETEGCLRTKEAKAKEEVRRSRLIIPNFSLGMKRDSALTEERLLSLRTLKNYFIDYSDGRLKTRLGYDRWNDTELDDVATQLFWFSDLEQNENLLGIVDGTWYQIKETGAHNQINTDTATARRPIVAAGQRVFFGTDTEAYWTDDSELPGGVSAFRLGIVPPQNVPTVSSAASQGNNGVFTFPNDQQQSDTAVGLRLDGAGHTKLAMAYTPGEDQAITNVPLYIRVYHQNTGRGSFRVAIHTGATEPAASPISTQTVSDYIDILGYTPDEGSWVDPQLQGEVELDSGTKYWFVLESDSWYIDNFTAPLGGQYGIGFYVSFAYTGGAAGDALMYDGSNWSNQTQNRMASFLVGGMNPGAYYDYKTTFYNDTYKSESRPSPVSLRLNGDMPANRGTISTEASGDGQVDFVGVYRRDRGEDPTTDEDDITGKFLWVGKAAVGLTYTDTKSTRQLGAELQSDDHYLYDDTDAEGTGVRETALIPEVMTYWKGRLWFAEANSNILYFSKKMETDGSMGLVGDSVPDYFPLENVLEINETSDIIALVPLSADELAIYFRNTSVWVLRGCDGVLNPPADIVLRQMVTDVGLIAPAAIDSIRGRHVFLTRKGLYDFKGTTNIDYLSGGIQTILDEIGDTYLDDSIIIAMGDSIWLAVDEDEDGSLENIYILDIQREIPTWRVYNYGVNLNDMVVRKTGTEYKTLLAADADNAYILQLENGTTDNGEAIVAELETQDLVVPNLATIYEVSIDAYYPNAPPVYEVEITDALNEIHDMVISPRSTDDIAGHKAYPIVTSAVGARVKVIQRTVNQNHLRGIDVGYVER